MDPYQDPEGHALVEAIHVRKARSVKVMTHEGWREVGTAGALSLTPAEDSFWEEETIKLARTASVQMAIENVSHEFMAMLLGYGSVAELREAERKRQELAALAGKWARGHGKRAAMERIRGRAIITDWLAGVRGEEYPWAESITWACAKPTDPVYPPGSNMWLMQEYERRTTPEYREYQRQIARANNRLMDDFAERLGMKPRNRVDGNA